ncbi:MAG: nucleotidyl transferase AbiEii/AbiGii toxin family protein, partial [Bacteroidaceae bacterium]|nr:nucleotidyl transferase AbiEii/AbiGii toxin family protein [Bacteroidaceae bacterium]
MPKNNYFELTTAQQRTILEQAAIKQGLPKQAIEKDLWVTAILQILFSLPCSENLVFKGGTSLSKVWKLISRFSEDIDLAIDRAVFELEGDLTKKQVKKLRKASSLFVRDTLCQQLVEAVSHTSLKDLCQIEPEPDGEGDSTYPEPRSIFIRYKSVFDDKLDYIPPIVKVEAGARSLLEPYAETAITSIVEEALPSISTTISDVMVKTAIAEKTFLEKAFLLHELFSVNNKVEARRRSRHIYDLHIMMQQGIADNAVPNDELWQTIHHHRSTLTSMQGVDYMPDIRKRIRLGPPMDCRDGWKKDYEIMTETMIYGE